MDKTISLHLAALKALQAAISDPVASKTTDVLCAAQLLSLYEASVKAVVEQITKTDGYNYSYYNLAPMRHGHIMFKAALSSYSIGSPKVSLLKWTWPCSVRMLNQLPILLCSVARPHTWSNLNGNSYFSA